MAERWVDVVSFAVRFRNNRLIGVKRWEALDLHQLGLEIDVETEVGLHKKRMWRLVRNPVFWRDAGVGDAEIAGVGEQFMQQFFAIADHLLDQGRGEEARCFAVAEMDFSAATGG